MLAAWRICSCYKMINMRIYIFLLTVCFTFQMRAQQVPDWENPRVVDINKRSITVH